jgi:hypothetical protein
VEPLGFDGVAQKVEFPVGGSVVNGAHGLVQAAVILDLFVFEEKSFDGTATVANCVLRGILFFRSARNFSVGVTHSEPILEWGDARNLSNEGYVADSVGEEKFRRFVTGSGL